MAVWFDKITPATGTTVTVTGIPFEPVAVLFFGIHNPATQITQSFGAASGSTEQWSMWGGIRQDPGTPYDDRRRELRDDCCINIYDLNNHAIIQSRGVLSALTSDGFSVAFTGAGSTQPVFYMAIGGRHIHAAHAGTFSAGASTGTVAVTAPGFEPGALVVAHHLSNALNTQEQYMCWGLGFTDGINQFSSFGLAPAPTGTATLTDHIQRSDAVACAFLSGTGTYRLEIASFDANGFTVDVTDAWPSNNRHGYLAIDTAAAVVGTSEFPDSTGIVSYATPRLEPGGVLFGWNGADAPTATGSSTGPIRPGVGGMDGVSSPFPKANAGAISALHRDAAPFGAYQPLQQWENEVAAHIQGAGSQVDVDAETVFSSAAFDAFAMNSFSLDWTIASTNSREFGWLALPGEIVAPWIPQQFRRRTL
jgi:hypothetical protein